MINLIGTDYNPEWRNLPCARVYWYGKEVRPGRKVGHINLVSGSLTELRETLILLGDLLPEAYYIEAINWSLTTLSE
jgi:5-(carboxyamino)imidazole ribonucleotide synthase